MYETLRRIDYPKELIEVLLKAKMGAVASNVMAPLMIFYLLDSHVPVQILFVVLVAQLLFFSGRMFIATKALEVLHSGDKADIDRMLRYYLFMIFMNALLLGVSALLAVIYATDLQIFILATIMAALSAGAASTLSPVFHALFIYITVMVTLFSISLIVFGDSIEHYALAMLLIIYPLATLPANFKTYRVLSSGIEQRDALEEKNSNFQNLLDSIMETVVIFDEDQRIVDVNRAGLRLFNIKERSDAIGSSISEFVPVHEELDLHQTVALDDEKPYELELRKSDGELFPALVSGKAMTMEGKQIQIATILDLTQVKQKDQLLFQQSRQAAMGEMIGNIAHQWRQPLNALSLLLQNIYYSFESGDLDHGDLERSMQKGQRLMREMSATIDDFRNFFRPDRAIETFSVSQVIKRAVDLMSASYSNNGIQMDLVLDDTLSLEGYPNEFTQVVLNILSNAKDALGNDHTKDALVKVTSRLEDDTVVVEIADNAGGVDEAIIKKVFDPYFTTKHQDVGTGIGLYMSKMIIEKNMGGRIGVANDAVGAVFSITVPRRKTQESQSETKHISQT